jgi:hypothetical protein
VFGVGIDSNDVAVIVAAVVLAVLLTLLLRATPFGLSARHRRFARNGARSASTRVRPAGSWMIGTALAGVGRAVGDAERVRDPAVHVPHPRIVRGGHRAMHSLPLAFFGSLALGVVQELSKSVQVQDFLAHFFSPQSVWIRGLPQIIPFAVMLIFLLAYSGLRSERFTTDTRRAVDTVLVDVDVAITRAPLWRRLLPVRPADRRDRGAVLPQRVVGASSPRASRCDRLPLASSPAKAAVSSARSPSQVSRLRSPPTMTNHGMAVLVAIPLTALIVVPVGLIAALPSLRVGDLYLTGDAGVRGARRSTYFELPSVNNFDQGVPVPRRRASATIGLLLPPRRVLRRRRPGRRNLKRSTTGLELEAMRSANPRRRRSASASPVRSSSRSGSAHSSPGSVAPCATYSERAPSSSRPGRRVAGGGRHVGRALHRGRAPRGPDVRDLPAARE